MLSTKDSLEDMDCDSDDDDDLLVGSGLTKRQEKAGEKAREKQRSILEVALSDSVRLFTSARRVSTLKKGNVERNDDELRLRAENLALRYNKENSKDSRNNLDDVEGIDLLIQDKVLDRQRRLELAHAADTEQMFYSSQEEAILDLTKLLETGFPDNQCCALENVLSASIENALLEFFFHDESSVARILQNHNVPTLRRDLFVWMKNTCQSAGLILCQDFLSGVQANLDTIIRDGYCPPQDKSVSVSQFNAELYVWIDLSSPTTDGFIPNHVNKNIPGLILALRYWYALLCSEWQPSTLDIDDASACLVRLCLLGLDYESTSSQTTRGIRGLINRIVPMFLDLVATRITDHETWMDNVVEQILKMVSMFGPGAKGTDDERDSKAWICHSVVLQSIPIYLAKDGNLLNHRLTNHFRAKLAVGALNSLSQGKAMKLFSLGTACDEEISSICTRTFNAAIGGLMFLISLNDGMLDVAPLCPAIVECATVAFESGCILMQLDKNSNQQLCTKTQHPVFVKVLDQLDGHAFQLRKVMSGMVTTNPHIRRADFHLQVWSQYFRVYLKEARSEDETPRLQQTSMSAFVKMSSEMQSES